jgi:phenylpropionate dioxygenase-like ring-hydroxylating dioxygenase large terminal subunit
MKTRTAYGAMTLPAEYYVSDDVFREETDRIFRRQWLCTGRQSELPHPGSFKLHETNGESIIVTRALDGIHAFYNVCRHRGTRLCTESTGEFPGKIQCPYHAWTYSLDGSLLGAPNMNEVSGFNRNHYPLSSVAVKVWEGFVFINLSENPIAFEDVFAPILNRFQLWRLSELRTVHRIDYDIQANWKLIFQNYSECYHCPKVHPMLSKLTPYRNTSIHLEEGAILGGPMEMSNKGGSMTVDGNRCASPLGEIDGDNLNLVHYYSIFPTMCISLHPDYLLVHRIERIGTGRSKITCEWMFHPEAVEKPGFDPDPAIEFWDVTNREDWRVSELSQLGIASRGYRPGPYSELESLLAAFDRQYLRSLGHHSQLNLSA